MNIWAVFHSYPVLSSFMTYHRVCSKSSTPGATSGAGTVTLPNHLSSHPDFSGVRVAGSLVFCVVFLRWLSFFLFGHYIVCPSIQSSDYYLHVGVFKIFNKIIFPHFFVKLFDIFITLLANISIKIHSYFEVMCFEFLLYRTNCHVIITSVKYWTHGICIAP